MSAPDKALPAPDKALDVFVEEFFKVAQDVTRDLFNLPPEEEMIRGLSSRYINPRYTELMQLLVTDEDPVRLARNTAAVIQNGGILPQYQVTFALRPGKVDAVGACQFGANIFFELLVNSSFTRAEDRSLSSDLKHLDELLRQLRRRRAAKKESDGQITEAEENELLDRLGASLINGETLAAFLRSGKNLPGQYL